MRKVIKRLTALVLCGCMVFSMPAVSSAEENEQQGLQESQKSGVTWEQVDPDEVDILPDLEAPEEQAEAEYADDEDVRVFIVFGENSALEAGFSTYQIALNEEAGEYMEELEVSQDEVIERIENEVYDGEALDVLYSFTLAANAVSAEVKYGDMEAISEVDGVGAVYLVPRYELLDETADPNTVTAADMIGSTNTWANGYTGAGMRIAVIDTGIDEDHPSFDGDAFLYGLEKTAAEAGKTIEDYDLMDEADIEAVLKKLNAYEMMGDRLSAADLNLSDKIAYAFNYVDGDLDVTHDHDGQGDHGTHVSGISLADRYVPDSDGGYADAMESVMAVGVAPDAQLLTMKVFGKGGGAYQDDYMAAIEDAILLGADAINLSLGSGSAGFTMAGDDWMDGIFENLVESDTVVSISAGNNSYWSEYSYAGFNLTEDINMATGGSPGTYANALTVASADNTGHTGYYFAADGNGTPVFYTESTDYGNVSFVKLDQSGKGTSYPYVMLAPGVSGATSGLEGVDANGKIVFIQRGESSFFEKANYAVKNGAAAVVIYNNQPGVIGLNLTGYEYHAPVVSILRDEGLAILKNSVYDEETNTYSGTMTVYGSIAAVSGSEDAKASMSAFSSWGIPGNITIKPEITAPGGSIYSTLDGGKYGLMSGTSMAAPSVAGMSALVLQYIEENGLAETEGVGARALAQALLMGTAVPMTDGESGVEYPVRQQGSGLANVNRAVQSPAYVLVDGQDDGKVKAELGEDIERTGNYEFTFTVHNMSDKTLYYDLNSSVLTADFFEDSGFDFMDIWERELGAETLWSLENSGELVFDFNEDGQVDRLDAMIVLQHANGKNTLTEAQCMIADVNLDGKVTTKDAQLILCMTDGQEVNGFTADQKTVELDGDRLTLFGSEMAEIRVAIRLTEDGRAFLEEYYPNGGYVEGFVYVNAAADSKGAVEAVDLSIPFLGFYGNWTDSSMFERSVYLDDYYNGLQWNYTANDQTGFNVYTNYFVLNRDGQYPAFVSNLYAEEAEYHPERNAISIAKGDKIDRITYSLIRNAAEVYVFISDADDPENVYFAGKVGSQLGAYWQDPDGQSGAWKNASYNAKLGWDGRNMQTGEFLEEGTRVVIELLALPEYYSEPGDGVTLSLPLTIDNTAPAVEDMKVSEDGQTLTITMKDNEYIAAYVLENVADTSGKAEAVGVNQENAGEEVTLTIARPDDSEFGTSIYTFSVVDYAGNSSTYRVQFDMEEKPAEEVTSVVVTPDTVRLLQNSTTQLAVKVTPVTAKDTSVTWSTSDETVATVDENGVVTAAGVGTATITATSVLTPEVSATCEVEVYQVDIDLNAALWDEAGDAHIVKFNTKNINDYQNLESEEIELPEIMGLTPYGDFLWGSTFDIVANSPVTDLYMVSPEKGYEAQLFGQGAIGMTDIDYSPYLGQCTLVGSVLSYLVYLDPTTGANEIFFGLEDEGVQGNITGVTYLGSNYLRDNAGNPIAIYDMYIIMVDNGDIYLTGAVNLSGDVYYMGLNFLGSTGIETPLWVYNSLEFYEDETGMYLLYSRFNGEEAGNVDLYMISLDEELLVNESVLLGTFKDDVWPITGLYQENELVGGASTEGRIREDIFHAEVSQFKISPEKVIESVPSVPVRK